MLYIVLGIFKATPATKGKGLIMNEMHPSTGFMNAVTSCFVLNMWQCSDQGNKVAAGQALPRKNEPQPYPEKMRKKK